MATVTVDVDVDLDEVNDDEILSEIRSRGYVVAKEGLLPTKDFLFEIDAAAHELRVGRRLEALVFLERALGHDWAGVLTQELIA
jgi:hypothetical protein